MGLCVAIAGRSSRRRCRRSSSTAVVSCCTCGGRRGAASASGQRCERGAERETGGRREADGRQTRHLLYETRPCASRSQARVCAAGAGRGHARRKLAARFARRLARVRHRRADPGRPRHPGHAPHVKQPEEVLGARGVSREDPRGPERTREIVWAQRGGAPSRRAAASAGSGCASSSECRRTSRPTQTTSNTSGPRRSGWATC